MSNMADFVPTVVDGLRVEQTGEGKYRTAVFHFENAAVPMVDEAGVVAYGSLKLGDFPLGAVLFLAGIADVDLTVDGAGIIDAFDGDIGVGTTAAGNNNALATTEQNIIPTTSTTQGVAGVGVADAVTTGVSMVSGVGGALDIYLNVLVDDADQDITGLGATNLLVNGDITVHYILVGDS